MGPRFERDKALERKVKLDRKFEKRQARQARNLARYAVQQANKGNIGVGVLIKTTGRFRPAPSLGETPPDAVFNAANKILSEEKEITIRRDYHADYSPNGRMLIKAVSQPKFPPNTDS